MPELLLELGTEELPANAVRRAYGELAEKVASLLIDEGVLSSDSKPISMGTPRRLIVCIGEVQPQQADSSKEQRGPGLKAAYLEDGSPTQALLGFCRGQGVDPKDLRQDGQYVWITKQVPGRATLDILADHMPKVIRSLTFDKTMRWGAGKMRFARPIRWMLATLDSQVIPFDLAGVESSNQSRGHRFYSPEPFEATNLVGLLKGLRSRHVEPDPEQRQHMILKKLPIGPQDYPELPGPLVDENVFLTEWPTPIVGEFEPEFLDLPPAVLITVMAKHEKMFPIHDEQHKITNRFIFVRNSGEDASVRKGCEWVLNARMNDAKFFFDEDRRSTLAQFLAKTKGIVFQEKLGTVHARSERLTKLAPLVCPTPAESEDEQFFAAEAGRLSKADLSSGLVSELASLQGIVGGIYAKREGVAEEICWAISSQYDPGKNPNPISAEARTAVRLVVADQLDKLAGYLGIGLEPSGSSDPYGLRRAVSVLIDAALGWPTQIAPYSELFGLASNLYADQEVTLDPKAGSTAFARLFAARYSAQMPGIRHDILEAALMPGDIRELTSPQSVQFRVKLMSALAEDASFVQTATRPLNIVSAALKKQIAISYDLSQLDPVNLESKSGVDLLERALKLQSAIQSAVKARDLDTSLATLRELQEPINRFFEETMVMVEEERIRDARLTLLAGIGKLLTLAGDFTKIVFEGNR